MNQPYGQTHAHRQARTHARTHVHTHTRTHTFESATLWLIMDSTQHSDQMILAPYPLYDACSQKCCCTCLFMPAVDNPFMLYVFCLSDTIYIVAWRAPGGDIRGWIRFPCCCRYITGWDPLGHTARRLTDNGMALWRALGCLFLLGGHAWWIRRKRCKGPGKRHPAAFKRSLMSPSLTSETSSEKNSARPFPLPCICTISAGDKSYINGRCPVDQNK